MGRKSSKNCPLETAWSCLDSACITVSSTVCKGHILVVGE